MISKKKTLILTIPEPCSENFNTMTPVKGGKFCGSCEKTIVDFRMMSDRQIINHYKKNKGKICGVFNEVQLNRPIPFPMEVQPNRNWKAVVALMTGLLFSGGLAGQSTIPTTENPIVLEQSMIKGKQSIEPNQTPIKKLKGIISGADLNEPLIGANVLIKGTTIGVATDLDGNFELSIPNNLTAFEIAISYTGYESETLVFKEGDPIPQSKIEFILHEGVVLEEVVVSAYHFSQGCILTGCGTWISSEIEYIPELEIIEAEKIPEIPEVKIFPNPFITNLNVTYDYDAKGDYLFHVYDMKGRLLFARTYNLGKGKQTVNLDMANQRLLDGMYILQISDKQDRILTTKKVLKG